MAISLSISVLNSRYQSGYSDTINGISIGIDIAVSVTDVYHVNVKCFTFDGMPIMLCVKALIYRYLTLVEDNKHFAIRGCCA